LQLHLVTAANTAIVVVDALRRRRRLIAKDELLAPFD